MNEQIEKQINEVVSMKIELEKCQKDLKIRISNGQFNNLDSLLEFFDYSIENAEILSTLKEPLSKDSLDSILILLNFSDYLNNPNISDFLKTTLISINNSKLQTYNFINGFLHNEEKYYQNRRIIYSLNKFIINLLENRFTYKNNVINFNKKIFKRVNEKLDINLPFYHEDIFKKFDNIKILEEFQSVYKNYINDRTNEIIKILDTNFNVHDNTGIYCFNNESDALGKITELVNKIVENLKNEKLKKSQESIIEMIEGRNEKYKERKDFNIILILGIDYKNDIYNCKSNSELTNQVKIYSDLIAKTTIILAWSYYLDIDITNSIDNIKKFINTNDIKYIINNYKQIIHCYIINYIEHILNNKFQLSNTNNIVAPLVQEYIDNYDNINEQELSNNIELITKESIKIIIKENIKAIPKKLFKSQFAVLATVDDIFNVFYDQLNKSEMNIDELIQLIIAQDEYFNKLNNDINEEIELIFMLLDTEETEIILNDFNIFINNCLSKYKDIESRNWILNYLKAIIHDNNELKTIIDTFDNNTVNEHNQNKAELNNSSNLSQTTISELSNISYVFLNYGLKNNINKNNFHSNEEREKYLYVIRECINYLISNNYKENNNSKFTLKKYQKSNICWKLKKTNNEMLIRMIINFQKDNIIIGSIFKRPETDRRYNHYIDKAENDINNIMNTLENNNIIQRLQFIYDNILNLRDFYYFLHNNISYLSLEDINEDNKLISQIIFKFINELNNINSNTLPFNIVENIDKIKKHTLTILEDYGYKTNGKSLIKK